MRKTYRVVNTASYTKRIILGSRTENVPAKSAIEIDLTEQEFFLARRSPDTLVSEVDNTPQKIQVDKAKLNQNEHYTGISGTIAPLGDEQQRPLYEHFMVEIFGLKSRIAQLEARNVELEAMIKACDYDGIIKKLEELKKRSIQPSASFGKIASSELLNVRSNPKENNRAIFEKLVARNKEIRR